jgi:hypothetical protein
MARFGCASEDAPRGKSPLGWTLWVAQCMQRSLRAALHLSFPFLFTSCVKIWMTDMQTPFDRAFVGGGVSAERVCGGTAHARERQPAHVNVKQ